MNTCLFCHDPLSADARKGSKFCGPKHRTAYWHQQRKPVQQQFAQLNAARVAAGLGPLLRQPALDALADRIAAIRTSHRKTAVLQGYATDQELISSERLRVPALSHCGLARVEDGDQAYTVVVLAEPAPALVISSEPVRAKPGS